MHVAKTLHASDVMGTCNGSLKDLDFIENLFQ